MKKDIVAPRIPEYIRKIVILSTILISVGVGLAITVQQFVFYQRVSGQRRQDVIEKHKQFVKDLIAIELDYVSNQKIEFDKRVAGELSESVTEAYQLATALYQRYEGKMSESEIKGLIIQAVASLHSTSPYTHVFINNRNGRGVFYFGNSDFNGKDLSGLEDLHGNKVIQAEINLINVEEEGFINYDNGAVKGHDDLNSKICFVKRFPHFNWYFGAKCYLDDYYEDFKMEIARKISSERFRYGGYVFMNELDGHPVVMDGKIYKGTFNFFDGSDNGREEIFKQQVEAAKGNADGGYFSYRWNKIGENEDSEKISYVRFFEPCEWLIGAGFYTDEVESEIAVQNKELKSGLFWNILQVIVILALAVLFELYLLYRFNRNFQADFNHFTRFFRVGKGRYQKIGVDKIHFREFKNMGKVANEMIEERVRVHEQLLEEQRRAQESDRLKTAFLANMSHEIRTPMNAILGFSELLNDEELPPDVSREFVRLILQNGEMLMKLINDIIDIAKIESGQMSVMSHEFNLSELLVSVNQHFQGVLDKDPAKNIQLELESNLPENFICQSDEFRLKQVLLNLVGNAVKFTSEGKVKLNVNLVENEKIIFNVSDTGIGIPHADIETIFERFMQAGNHLSKNFGGTGLGLAISKNIVNILGGEISVKSDEGKGSQFEFYIPVSK
ncbi:cache domain-containing protein [Mangrovibacterium diazotrophicum]|uniref:histidine kinase n=1 Tax=Mangrovibacterium diazotrophicum TaxID=1261403 RepID=A0A419VXG3_9BACT|nr:cache domain-containing protein [Mangrovibacterium diazotrophicum]RKD87921.1 signal transduction histidine kinase [Mangrovibacterium diazotrophicum]